MGKDKKTPITVNDKEYFVEEMTEQQQTMVNHLATKNGFRPIQYGST